MVSTREEPAPEVLSALRRAWPALPWERAEPAHGAFHRVLVIPGTTVVRLRDGAGHRTAVDRELRVAGLLADVGLRVPAPQGTAVHGEGWSAGRWEHAPGRGMRARSWAADRSLLLEILERWRDAAIAHPGLADALPPVRTWCGGEAWPRILEEITARDPELRRRALDAAADVRRDETGPGAEEATLVHGDLGPHNILRDALVGDPKDGADDSCGPSGPPWIIDVDHAAWADPAVDVAPLLAFYPRGDLARDLPAALLDRAVRLRRSLPLQVAAAAHLRGDIALREHALGRAGNRLTDVPRP
ncbi:phosphotransferase family protein [Brachybacterium sp. DNPG3]